MKKRDEFQVPYILGLIGACIVLLNSLGVMGFGMFSSYMPMMQYAFRGFSGFYIGLGFLSLIAGVVMILVGVIKMIANRKPREEKTAGGRFCPKCGTGLGAFDRFCPRCGNRAA